MILHLCVLNRVKMIRVHIPELSGSLQALAPETDGIHDAVDIILPVLARLLILAHNHVLLRLPVVVVAQTAIFKPDVVDCERREGILVECAFRVEFRLVPFKLCLELLQSRDVALLDVVV